MRFLLTSGVLAALQISLATFAFHAVQAEDAKESKGVKIELTEADKAALAKLRELGAMTLQVAQNDNRVEVAYHLSDGKIGNDHVAPLKGLKCIYSLNLRGTEVDDKGVAQLADTTGLVKLHLEKTKVTDEALKHLTKLENLEYLNVYGTEVTNAGLDTIVPMKNLKKIYIWQTKVDIDGVAKLKAARPDLQIIPDLVA
ncbi:MAG: hypothetical protein O2983_09655, partial [Planctomycetota bacterium]|nr:hypothetical protein [Planctomycetota bacterium]